MKHLWRKIPILAGILGILNIVAMEIFFNMAAGRFCIFFRKQKKEEKRRAKADSGSGLHQSIGDVGKKRKEMKVRKKEEGELKERYDGIRWIESMDCEHVETISQDGLILKGCYLEAAAPKRIIVLFHGWRGSWRHDFGACVKWLYEEESSLLLIEQRAQGESEGKYMGFGILEKKDCNVWLEWLGRRNSKALSVYLYGVSMGAATVLMAAGEELPAEVKGVIADCGFTSPYDMVYRFGHSKFKLSEHPLMDEVNWLCRRRAGYDLKEYSAPEAMAHCQVPVLFIHGKADTFVPYEMTMENYKACTAKKKLLLVDGAGHCMSFLKDEERYKKAVLEFFRDTIALD